VDVLDRACIEECPVDCIYAGRRTLYIHPGECVDCGACEPVCPVEAIFYEEHVPSEWSAYTRANAELFDDLGSPGGASKVRQLDRDVGPAATVSPRRALDDARELIATGRYIIDDRDAWSDHQPSTQRENAFIERHGMAVYGKWHLGIDETLDVANKGRYKFPYETSRRSTGCTGCWRRCVGPRTGPTALAAV
jgi:NAD-dependent dihydropyrimidine dehydrogenase PreA subunit